MTRGRRRVNPFHLSSFDPLSTSSFDRWQTDHGDREGDCELKEDIIMLEEDVMKWCQSLIQLHQGTGFPGREIPWLANR